MSLLSLTVKKARFVGVQAQQFNTYVTLKLQNVKSTTVTVKGANPCWEQDFLFETNDVNTGLLVEVWSKGMLWDRALGYHYIPLPGVSYANEDDCGQWVSLDSELEMRGGEVVGTKCPTGHSLLIACRFEQPFDPENTEAADLQRKLEMLNNTMDQEARAEQARRQLLYNIGHSGYSEDSDYTSDLNYPVGGQGANSSASQFRTAANQLATPQRSLETSRENSYERDDHQVPVMVGGRLTASNYSNYIGRGHSPRYDDPYPSGVPLQRYNSTFQQQQQQQQQQHSVTETSEPLSYNSRPRGYKEYRRRKHTWDYEDSQDGWYSEGYDYPNTRIADTRIYSDTEYYPSTTSSKIKASYRRPSLERQITLYDEQQIHYCSSDVYTNDTRIGKMSAIYPECQTDIIHDDYYDNNTGYVYQDERYGQDDEDRQWDSGGKWYLGTNIYQENKRNRKSLPQRPASSIGIHRPNHRPTVTRQRSYESDELDYNGTSSTRKRKMLQPQQRPNSHHDSRAITGKKLPPTPTKPSNITLNHKTISLPATPGRQLPRTRTPPPPPTAVDENYYKSDYNEDYNYAYQGSQDNLQQSISQYPDDMYSTQLISTITTTKGFNVDNESENDDEIYSETQNFKSNQYHPDYITRTQQNNYHQSYPTSTSTYDTNNQQQVQQQYIDNSFMNNYQPTLIQQEQHQQQQQQQGVPIYHEPTSIYQNNTYPIVSEIENYDNNPDELLIDDNIYKNTYEENYQDSYSESFKQDSFPESYTDSYKDDNYHDEQTSAVAFSDYNNTSNYQQQQVATSVYNHHHHQEEEQQQQRQHDNNISQIKTEYPPPVSSDNYQQQQNDLKHQNHYNNYGNDYSDNYHDQYSNQCHDGDNYRDNCQEVPELSITTPKGQTKTNGYQPSESQYFHPKQIDLIDTDSLMDTRKQLGKRDISPFLQQNIDSLESRDDELKDSFDTAVSSVGSSQARKGLSEYSTAGESSPIAATIVDSPIISAVSSGHHYLNEGDEISGNVTTALVHTKGMSNGKRQLARNDSYVVDEDIDEERELMIQDRNRVQQQQQLQQIDDVDDEEYSSGNVLHKSIQRKDSQLSYQSQISQQEEQQQQQQQQQGKLSRGDSYVDEQFEEEFEGGSGSGGSRRESYQGSITGVGRKNSYRKGELTRGGSIYGHNYATPQPISRAESYQRGYFKDQQSIDGTEIVLSNAINGECKMRDETLQRYERGEEALARGSRENSLVEPYKSTPPLSLSASPRGSIIKQTSLDDSVQMDTPPRSPPEPLPDEDILDMVGAPPVPTQLKERPEMTAKQRWHWAYNKITMQLNVSTEKNYYLFFFYFQ